MKALVKVPLALAVLHGLGSGMLAAQPPDVTFFDGSYTELCSQAAHNVDAPGNVPLTGTRLGMPPIDICTLAIREDTTSYNRAGSYNNRGVLLFAEGRLDEALADFDEAVRIRPDLGKAHINRGFILVGRQRWEEAVAAFDRGIPLITEDAAKAHFNRAIAHEELGHLREAYQDYLRASELDPLWQDPKRELARFNVRPGT